MIVHTFPNRVFRWTEETGLVYVNGIHGFSQRDISADGSVVVGGSRFDDFSYWSEESGAIDLPNAPGSVGAVYGRGITPDGTVVVGQSGHKAFRWTKETGSVGLGFLSDSIFFQVSDAWDVTSDGSTIVGKSYNFVSTGDGLFDGEVTWEAFRWTEETGMVGLGIPAGYKQSWAAWTSADGSVIAGVASRGIGKNLPDRGYFRWTEEAGWGLPLVGTEDFPKASFWNMSTDGSIIVGQVGFEGGGYLRQMEQTVRRAAETTLPPIVV